MGKDWSDWLMSVEEFLVNDLSDWLLPVEEFLVNC